MRFQQLPPFEKHLEATADIQGSVYTLLAQDPIERKLFRDKILEKLSLQGVAFEIFKINLEGASFQTVRQELDSSDLFSLNKVYILTHLEKASKQVLDELPSLIKKISYTALIFEADDGKVEAKLYEKLKKEMIALDLLKEKPWDKKGRFFSYALQVLQKSKKGINKEVLEWLYESTDKQFSFFVKEIEKLDVFTYLEPQITMVHVQKVGSSIADVNTYLMCEGVVFGLDNGFDLGASYDVDQNNFFSLIGQLRFQFHLGVKISGYLLKKTPKEEYEGHFSYSVQKNLNRYLEACQAYGSKYFEEGLDLLFKIEKKSKTESSCYQSLWVGLLTRFKQLQERVS